MSQFLFVGLLWQILFPLLQKGLSYLGEHLSIHIEDLNVEKGVLKILPTFMPPDYLSAESQ